MSAVSTSILDHFSELTDPRRRAGTSPLINVVAIALCAVICSADDFVAIAGCRVPLAAWPPVAMASRD